MNWREFIEMRKKHLLIFLLPILLIVSILLLRSCDKADTDDVPAGSLPVVQDDGQYVPSVSYLIRLSPTDEDPASLTLEVSPSGKAYVPSHINDMEDVIWSGWLTEEGEPFDFDTVLTQDLTLYCVYWDDQNNNNIIDGSASDPITVYEFWHNDYKMLTRTFFGQDVELDYHTPEYAFPQSEGDGYVFLGWAESRFVSDDGGKTKVILNPELAADRNNNDLADGSDDDPFVYHVFLDQDGTVLEEKRWLAGEPEIQADDIACPTTTKQKLVGWIRSESTNEAGNVVYTYTPDITEQ